MSLGGFGVSKVHSRPGGSLPTAVGQDVKLSAAALVTCLSSSCYDDSRLNLLKY